MAIGLFVLGLSLTLIFKGHNIKSEISDNENMRKLGIKCAAQQMREEECDFRKGKTGGDLGGSSDCAQGGCASCASGVQDTYDTSAAPSATDADTSAATDATDMRNSPDAAGK